MLKDSDEANNLFLMLLQSQKENWAGMLTDQRYTWTILSVCG